ncbi:hypothetical protein [Actinoplanes sp. L3-i22]|uniref:hypothetical protein n=1 Tax=Actinoplanes sp. L3-i22 TaxID=2836373 RepID=UPI001C787797|nr:hypothetical protein [Actinoplanes sp. L3-i22]BCY10395.1 hypothetical protein L3i22_054830 [Actinoplanes sp. L3-i22]
MTTDAVDPRRLLSDVDALTRRVRVDQRVTWVALATLAAVTFAAIPIDWFGMRVHCFGDGSCQFNRLGTMFFWPPALLLSYTVIAVAYLRIARSRGVETRVLPYAITGAALTVVFTAAWIAARIYLAGHPVPANPQPTAEWIMFLDRLVAPAGTIGIALLVLARLERNLALLGFTVAYLAVVLIPVTFGWQMHTSVQAEFLPPQAISGLVLLLGAAGFGLAQRRQR